MAESRPPVVLPVPPSKSVTHRALLLGALSRQPCRVVGPLWGADCRSTLAVLQSMGARARRVGDDVCFEPVADLQPPRAPLDCGNSGTTLRLMMGQGARLAAPVAFTGDASLQSRPNGPLLAALGALGVATDSDGGTAPLTLQGPLRAGSVTLPPRVSSQYASALLLSLCLVPGDSTLRMDGPVASRPYLDITRQLAARAGLAWTTTASEGGLTFHVPGGQRPDTPQLVVDGDWSGAAFPLIAGVLSGRAVHLRGLRPDSPQGDRAVVAHLRQFGQQLDWSEGVLQLTPRPPVAPGALDLGATPDLFPALVALAAATPGTTTFVGAPSLRHKESDRITAMAEALSAVGVRSVERPDGLVVHGGGPLHGAEVASHHDHRIYMAMRCLSLRCGGVSVRGAGCEAVSYPAFESHLAAFR